MELSLQASRWTMLELLSSVGGFRGLRQSCVLYILSNAINALIQTLAHIIRCDSKQYECSCFLLVLGPEEVLALSKDTIGTAWVSRVFFPKIIILTSFFEFTVTNFVG